jgi:uncharacterized heparinase superfamily protein
VRDLTGVIRRGLRKPPRVILARIASELSAELERFRVPMRRRRRIGTLLGELGAGDLDGWWQDLGARPYPALVTRLERDAYDASCPEDRVRIFSQAEDALAHRVDLLGSGKVELGEAIEWLTDFKSGFGWPARYFRDIDYNNPERPSDVKVPWELSRLQWMIPAGQAYLLTGDERYARGVRSVLEHWIDSNPYAGTVNWACTMEVALRILTWTWFFHVFHDTRAWSDAAFREKFLHALFLHVEFTERHIERSDVNGNHYTADAAGLVFGGLFFGTGRLAQRWQRAGWAILSEEIERQVYPDGVDFEASAAYHRLVAELFLLPALYRTRMGLPVEAAYRMRLEAMASFTAAYTKPDGTAPLWGDADDARALPFGAQGINDHRYLIGLIGAAFGNTALTAAFSGPREEIFWVLGKDAADALPAAAATPPSTAFPASGFYVMRGRADYVFIDCGPIGLAGRGGHGHNDCLAFEAVLDGVPLISDCGAYLYTASYAERNAFRSTAYHNTPQVDGEEMNRFIRPDYLWNLHYDAAPRVLDWQVAEDHALFVGEHEGYRRLSSPVLPKRTILLDFNAHALYIADQFEGGGLHDVCVPLYLAPGVEVAVVKGDELMLDAGRQHFRVWWPDGSGYVLQVEDARVSPSYGIALRTKRLRWTREAATLRPLALFIAPAGAGRDFEPLVARRLSRL